MLPTETELSVANVSTEPPLPLRPDRLDVLELSMFPAMETEAPITVTLPLAGNPCAEPPAREPLLLLEFAEPSVDEILRSPPYTNTSGMAAPLPVCVCIAPLMDRFPEVTITAPGSTE